MLKQFLSVIFDEESKRSVKRAGKKTLSVALALLMVYSMFAFMPEMFTKAEAADSDRYGQHLVRISLDVGSDEWECDAGVQLKVCYRETKTGTIKEAVICTTEKDNFNTKNKTYWLGNASSTAGMDDTTNRDGVYVDGFPTGWNFTAMRSNNCDQNAAYTGHLWVYNESSGSWVEVATISDSIKKESYFNNKNNQVATSKYPTSTTLVWNNPGENQGQVQVPATSTNNTLACTAVAPVVYDQYGVVLTTSDLAYRVYDAAEGGNVVSTDYFTATPGSDNKPTLSVKNAAGTWVLDGGSSERTVYVQAYVNDSANSGSDRWAVNVSLYNVTVNYNLNGGEYWGTEDDHSATASEQVKWGSYPVSIPAAAYRKGYTYNGIFTATSGGTKITSSTQIKPGTGVTSLNYYAQWTAVDNYVEFYNSDGQLISKTTGKYNEALSSISRPSTPVYPGKTTAIQGTYTFDKWIVWDCPTHPEWIGDSIDSHTAYTLDSPEDKTTAIKFIATYTLSGSAQTYTATYKDAGSGEVTTTTAVYWTPITVISAEGQNKLNQGAAGSAVTDANGFDLANFDYTFVGWTTVTPENGKWGTEEDVEYAAGDTFRLKEDVTLYPCYSSAKKQCQIDKYYYVLNGGNIEEARETVEKSGLTELGKPYDLGAADPFSFNYGGFTYTFKGWRIGGTTDPVVGALQPGDIEYSGGSALIVGLEGDTTVYAVYEQTEIKYNAYYYNGSSLIASYEDLSRYVDTETLATYNTASQFTEAQPTRERAGQTGFTFAGWVEDNTKVLNPAAGDLVTEYTFGDQSKSFYAAYNTFDYYTVTFLSDEGALLQKSANYVADDVIAFTATAPETADPAFIPVVKNKASGAQFQYTFMGWQSDVDADNTLTFEDEVAGTVSYAVAAGNAITVNGDRTYTAVFKKEIREYEITLYGIGVNPEEEGATPIAVLTLKYGDNILDAVEALYGFTSNDDVSSINGQALKIVPYGEEEEKNLPYSTDQYSYSFNGWSPAINPNATVSDDKTFVATYRTDNVLYEVHWFTPTACDASEPYAAQGYSEQKTYYRYGRVIGIPAKTPVVAAPATIANYTWTFLGWYECDANKVIKTDGEGNEIKYSKGTQALPGDNHNTDFYYVAKFGYVANDYTVNVYDELGTTLLGTYKGAYGQPVNIQNFKKNSDNDYHYTLAGFVDIADLNEAVIPADTEADTTAYTVSGNIDLKVKYTAAVHDWANAAIEHTALPTYEEDGLDTYTCACGWHKTEVVDKLVDVNGPVGRVAIKSYNWDAEGGAEEAYIRADSLVAIMAVDRGVSADVTNEGEGIKKIEYTWSDGTTDSEEYEQYVKTSANLDISLPDTFTAGMTLTAVITDWTDREYTITTGALYVDTVKPVIEYEATCEGFRFGVIEDHLNKVEVTLDGEAFDISAYAATADGYAAAYVVEKTETEIVPEGTYVVKATDKAGFEETATFTVTNAHEWNDGKVTTKATCSEDGEKTFTCTVCGAEKVEVIAATGHEWNEDYTVDTPATCEADGAQSIYCALCGEMMPDSTTVIPAPGHSKVETVKDATCKAAGYKIVTCENCDLYEYTTIAQLEHVVDFDAEGADEDGFVVGKEATCTAKGEIYQICELCGEHINKADLPIVAHDFDEITPEGDYCVAAPVEGATEDTYHLYKCADCGYQYEFNAAAKTHDIQKTLKTAATCVDDAIYTYSCTKCDKAPYDEAERLTKLGHDWDEDFTIDTPATCTTDGQKSIHCSRCDEVKDVTVIPAGHKFEVEVIPATCHSEEKTVYTCSECPYTYEEITGPALESEHVWDEGVATTEATCTAEGVMTFTCTVEGCGATETEVIPMKAHEASEEVIEHTDATCKAYEKTVYKCKNCEDGTVTVYGTEYADHVKGSLVKTTTKATCTEDGEGIFNCSVCGQTFTAVIPATGEHNYVGKVTTAATCTEKGVKTYTCSSCGDTYTEDIDPLGHNYVPYSEDATCTAEGYTCNKCTRCEAVEEGSGSTTPVLGHDIITVPAVEATCTKTGLTEGKKCSRCDYVEIPQTVVEKKAHTKGELITTNTAATCVATGVGVYKCTVCGGTFTAEIPADATAHNWGAWGEWTVVTPATCTAEGNEKSVRACLNDGCTATEEKTRTIDVLGHDLVVDYVGDPVTVAGVTTITTYYKCTRCDYTKSEDEVTTLYTVTVDGAVVQLFNGEKLTEEKIAAALGELPTKEAELDKDGVYKTVWYVDDVETALPATIESDATVTYDFEFVPNTYTVTFYKYSGKIISQTEYVKGATVAVPEDEYVSGYKFLGWTDGTNNYAPDAIPAVTEAVSYTPWIVSNENFVTYYVTFKNETGTKTLYTATVEAQKDETVDFALPTDLATPTKDANSVYHYTFAGWVDKDGNAVTFPVEINANVTYKATFTYAKHEDSKQILNVSPASCISAEITKYKCSVCGYTWDVYTAPASGHNYIEIGRTVEGNTTSIKYHCTVCDDEYTRTVTSGTMSDVIVVKVTDGSNPVSGAKVTVYMGNLSAFEVYTDGSGCAYFNKDQLPDGTYQTKVTKDNYDSAAGQMVVKNGTAVLKITLTKQPCHCVCHADSFFGKIRRFFNKIFRFFNSNYTCCSCGECERIY